MTDQSSPQLRMWWRHWSVVLILAVLAGVVIWVLVNLGPWLRSWQDQRAATVAQKLLEKAYREDKYGGKTPEETFDMFIAALEKGDTDLASKYFVLNKQEQWRKTLEEYKEKVLITDFVVELKKERDIWQKLETRNSNSAEFSYSFTLGKDSYTDFNGQKVLVKAGEHNNSVIFQKYPSEVWKISVL